MARLTIYRTYRWIDKDPIIDAVRTVCQDERLKSGKVHQISGVATATLDNWFNGTTRKPQNSTVTAVTSSLGYVRHDRLKDDGTVEVAFEKSRDLNYQKEIEKQADWIIKHASKTKRRRKRKNGH